MDFVEVGYVARAHGLRGELSLRTHDPHSTVYETVDEVFIGGRGYVVVSARPSGKTIIVSLRGVSDRNAAEALRGSAVSVPRDKLPVEEDEMLLSDLVGLEVIHQSGQRLGRVTAIEMGPQDRLVVRGDGVERLIPVVAPLVGDVDFEAGRILVDLPEDWPETAAEPE